MDNSNIMSHEDLADVAYKRLLTATDIVNPNLTKVLQEKYDEDRRDFYTAAQEAVPSQDPAYWSKNSCSKCYGQGILGKRHIFQKGQFAKSVRDDCGQKLLSSVTQVDISCKCTQKGYLKWLAKFRVDYNLNKAEKLGSAEGEKNE